MDLGVVALSCLRYPQAMSAPVYSTPSSTTAIAVDSSDPNSAAPGETRKFHSIFGEPAPSAPYILPLGGGVTVQLWLYSTKLARWFKVGGATVCAADTMTTLPIPPTDCGDLFPQITANSTCTQYSIGFLGKK